MYLAFSNEHILRIKQYSSDDLLKLRRSIEKPYPFTLAMLKQFDIPQYRGYRGGKSTVKRTWDTNDGVKPHNLRSLPEAISTVKTIPSTHKNNHRQIINKKLIKTRYKPLNNVKGQTCIKVSCFNSRSVSKKALSIYTIYNHTNLISLL